MTVRPKLSPGWKACSIAPDNVYAASDTAQLGNDPDWTVTQYKEIGGGIGDLTYLFIKEYMGTDEFWAYPEGIQCGASSTSSPGVTSAEKWHIKEVQKALNEYYDMHPNYPLTVDGIWGPKTCKALYGFQQDMLKDSGVSLKAETFNLLYLPGADYAKRFQTSCTPWYSAPTVPAPVTTPSTGEPEPTITVAAGPAFPWLEVLLGAATGATTGYVVQRKGKVKTSSAKASGAGAMGGALVGYLVGKFRS